MKPFTTIAAAIFALMAVVHVYRIAVGFPVTVGSVSVAPGLSWVGAVVAAVLAVGLFKEARR